MIRAHPRLTKLFAKLNSNSTKTQTRVEFNFSLVLINPITQAATHEPTQLGNYHRSKINYKELNKIYPMHRQIQKYNFSYTKQQIRLNHNFGWAWPNLANMAFCATMVLRICGASILWSLHISGCSIYVEVPHVERETPMWRSLLLAYLLILPNYCCKFIHYTQPWLHTIFCKNISLKWNTFLNYSIMIIPLEYLG